MDLPGAQGPGWKLLDGAEGNAVGLAQGAIDGAGFGHAHLGVVEDERRDVAGMGITVADEAAAFGGFVYGSLEDPEALFGMAQWEHRLGLNAVAVAPLSQAQQIAVGNIGHRSRTSRRYASRSGVILFSLLIHTYFVCYTASTRICQGFCTQTLRSVRMCAAKPSGTAAMNFGALLRRERIRAGLSQQELAVRCGVSGVYIYRLEKNGIDPPARKMCLKLARVLKLDATELWRCAFTARLERWLKKEGFKRTQERALESLFDSLTKEE